jgi:hypothetical protein
MTLGACPEVAGKVTSGLFIATRLLRAENASPTRADPGCARFRIGRRPAGPIRPYTVLRRNRVIINISALCFGVVVGWVTSRTLRRSTSSGLSDIATVIGAVGGAAITGIYKPSADAFGYYAIGLAAGFFAYLIIAIGIAKKEGTPVGGWLGSA